MIIQNRSEYAVRVALRSMATSITEENGAPPVAGPLVFGEEIIKNEKLKGSVPGPCHPPRGAGEAGRQGPGTVP